MADLKISALTASTTPLAGTEVLPIVQSSTTKQVSVANLTAGRTVGTGALNTTGKITVNLDGALGLRLNNTTGGAGQGIEMLTSTAKYSWLLGAQYNVNDGFEITPSTAVGGTSFTTPAFKVEYVGGGVFNTYVGTGNLVFSTSGRGIDFSATPGTGTSELLNDYEEGTWTPGITFGGGSTGVTYTSTQGYYTKVGNVVTVSCYINMSNKGSSTGVARITALPFTCANNAAAYAAPSLFFANLTFTGQVNAYVNINDTTIDLFNTSVLGAASALTDTNFANNTGIIINLTYRAI
jgi:hypothetical protein